MIYDRFGDILYYQEQKEISSMDACKELYEEWEKFKYGIPYKKEIIDIPKEEDYVEKHYKFLSPDKFEEYGGGICWDFVEYGDKFLRDKGIEPRKFYLWTETPPNWTTHTFLVVPDEEQFIYVESAFGLLKGVKTYKTIDEIFNLVIKSIFKCDDNSRRFDQFKYALFEFTGVHPPYGCTAKQYKNWIPENCDSVKDGVMSKDTEKPVQESAFSRLKELGMKHIDCKFDKLYFASPTKYDHGMDLTRPLFLTPYKGIASLFCLPRDSKTRGEKYDIPRGIDYNINYDEWSLPKYQLKEPLDVVHVNIQGYPQLREKTITCEGYIHELDVSDLKDHLFVKPWMDPSNEMILCGVKHVDFTNIIHHKVHAHIVGSELTQEAALSTKDRNELKEDCYGIPELRKYPLTDKDGKPDKNHILQAVRYFNSAPDNYKKELARNIVKFAKQLNMNWENWEVLKPYLTKDDKVQESTYVDSNTNIKNEYTIKDVKDIASKIHKAVVEGRHSLMNNQNCQLCTWCMELNLRRINYTEDGIKSNTEYEIALPRPIHSPRDPALEVVGESIVKNVIKRTFSSKNDLVLKIKNAGDQSRYYVHVKWKDSLGGHEFLCINIKGDVYLVDAQQNLVISMDNPKTKEYFDDINYKNSYMCRLDTCPFDFDKFEKYNNKSMMVQWNPDKDIPYMREHDLLSAKDEEYLKSMKTESNVDIIDDNILYYTEWGYEDLRNGVNPRSKKLFFHISDNDKLDEKELKPRVPSWIKNVKDPKKMMEKTNRWENIDTPRVCFSPSIEGCLNAIMNIHKIMDKDFGSKQLYVFIPEKPFNEYKHKTNKDIIKDGDVFDAKTTGEVWIMEPVKLKFYGTIQVDQVRDNGKSYPVIGKDGKPDKNDKIGRYTYRWHWLIHPSVQQKMDQYDEENKQEELNKKKEGS